MTVKRNLVFLHRFQQRALCFGRGAVDFVREHQLREDGTALKAEFAGFPIEDGHAEHVSRQQVAGELNALKRQSQGLRNAMRERGLAHPGNILDEQMAARQQAGDA